MIVVTGAAGFIGSCMVSKLNAEGFENIVIVDDFTRQERLMNWQNKKFVLQIDRSVFLDWFADNFDNVEQVYHLGARTDTTEFDWNVFLKLNVNYSKRIWEICSAHNIPIIYASSAATYGAGEQGYDDDLSKIKSLKPLNPYGKSKQEFDIWQLEQKQRPDFWAGVKFFNVYGPNEYHKGRMASVILHTFEHINKDGKMGLFKSYKQGFADGMQLRDFVYVKDLIDVMFFLMQQGSNSSIYNIGTGHARSFYDLACNTFKSMDKQPNIEFVDMPLDIRDKYQYFTEAKMDKLFSIGYTKPFYSLEEGVKDYVQNYLIPHKYL